jgi:hypothetical protein
MSALDSFDLVFGFVEAKDDLWVTFSLRVHESAEGSQCFVHDAGRSIGRDSRIAPIAM